MRLSRIGYRFKTIAYTALSYTKHNPINVVLEWWGGYVKADERNRLQAVIKKAILYGYLPRSFSTLDKLSDEDSDEKLFFLSRYNPNHVLHRLLPQPKNTGYNLRQRTHDFTLPTDISVVMKQNCF